MNDRHNATPDFRCTWHAHATPLEGDEPWNIACDCGTLLQTKDCEGCGVTFLDWSAGSYDDVMSAPASTSDGDLVCIPCARNHEREEREREEYDADGYEPDSFETLGLRQSDFL